ncbi:MAG: DUF6683 family protein [Planctomycetota bacterium]
MRTSVRHLVLLCLLAPAASYAQLTADNPLVAASQKIGLEGLTKESAAEVPGWAFKPAEKRVFLKKFVKSVSEDAAERSALEQAIVSIIDRYEGAAKELKQANDPATAMAFSVAVLYGVAKESELDDAAFLALAGRFRRTFGEIKATDREKQEFYEWSLCSSGMVVALAGSVKDEEAKKNLRTLAEAQFVILLGAKLEQISLKGAEVAIKASAPGGAAPGFGFTVPEGWKQNSGWYVAESRVGSHLAMAQVRIVPAMPATGTFTDALRTAWKAYVPEEFQGKASGMVFRRYIGDGLFAQFVCGKAEEKGRSWDTLFTVFLIDCGSAWQPVVVAQTWEDLDSKNPVGGSMSAGFSFPGTADLAEVFLKTLKCEGAKGKPLAEKASLVGDYSYGSYSSLDFENIYTGATSTSIVSYGGTLSLKADDSFADTFGSASGQVGAPKIRSATGKGKWALEGDLLVLTYSEYDQGDDYVRKEKKYRIAGVVVFPDGERVIVLKDSLEQPVNAVTVMNKSEYFSTKK